MVAEELAPARGGVPAVRTLSVAGVVAAYLVSVVGGIVRVTGSGLGCPDWPLCHGSLIPPLDLPAWLEYSHRLASTVLVVIILWLVGLGYRHYRSHPWVWRPILFSLVLLVVQAGLGGATVLTELHPLIAALHLGNAMLLLAVMIFIAVQVHRTEYGAVDLPGRKLVWGTVGATYLAILLGAWVTRARAMLACSTWPLCDPALVLSDFPAAINFIHRLAVLVAGLHLLAAAPALLRQKGRIRMVYLLALVIFGAQVLVGGLALIYLKPLLLRGLHLALAGASWAVIFYLGLLVWQPAWPEAVNPTGAAGGKGRSPGWVNYLMLTKPWITALLLVTMLSGMLMAARGLPPLPLLLWTLLGGFCAAGGANSLNNYFDRDIDRVMVRTRRRPLPSGRLPPRAALVFGLVLLGLSAVTFAVFVNPLSAVLALGGAFYYVVIYTLILKRRSPHNVVIGGAAGSFPPLVGWAAVTGGLDLIPLYLAAVIFLWTPPHTWALTLVVERDYEAVGVPMLPVAAGETETRRQIWLYSLILTAFTGLPILTGSFGPVYALAALLLGLGLLRLAYHLINDPSRNVAWRLYRYSNWYLLGLCLAMLVDRIGLGWLQL